MLDQVGTVVLIASAVVVLGAVAAALPGSLWRRLLLLGVGGVWMGLATALAGSGALLGTSGVGPVPAVGVLVMIPLLAAGLAAAASPAARAAMLALPTRLLVGLNTLRVLGVFFLLLAAQGVVGGPFPYSAGWGDIVTGLAAPVVLVALRQSRNGPPFAARLWNWFGALDLVMAVGLGAASGDGSPLQVFHTGIAGPLPVQSLPWSLIPTVLVPMYLILHAILHVQLRGHAAVGAPARA